MLELIHFAFSHYNEKARWALDHKRLPHRRRALLPGPHVPVAKRLTGKTETPILLDEAQTIAGSAAIIDHLERTHPERPLYPADPELCRRALDIQRFFDDEIGAEARRAFFLDFLADGAYAAGCFAAAPAFSPLQRGLYRLAFPLVRPVMRRQMALYPEHAETARAALRRGLDFVAANAGPGGFLVGDAFTVADLSAAALLHLVVFPPEAPPGLPEPRSPALLTWLARWSDHPGTAWVLAMYRGHRPPSAEIP